MSAGAGIAALGDSIGRCSCLVAYSETRATPESDGSPSLRSPVVMRLVEANEGVLSHAPGAEGAMLRQYPIAYSAAFASRKASGQSFKA